MTTRPSKIAISIMIERLERLSVAMALTPLQFEWFCMNLIPEWFGEMPQSKKRCPYPPGDPNKISYLIDRLKNGEALWHPHDAAWNADGEELIEED